ncbi:MAG TPA: aminotransferase class I/II-fold pyridoxal phosphate-dependent enzyme [Gaiellaceae bacterium]|nr:aminotransferase class I/II-fold pyridoxal phosphate-dependent enzyme [Gaiellaceae bacterium]
MGALQPPQGIAATVPFLDLARQHEALKAAVLADLDAVIDANAFTNGPHVAAFEEAFAASCGARECVGVASGLDALRLGLLAAGLEPGEPVAVPAATFAATFEAVAQAGGTPVPVDVRVDDYCLDAAQLPDGIRVVVPVHLYGQLADVRALAGRVVVADACQAHGARRDGAGAADGALAAAFSFYPGKNLGAFGDAGALVTSDGELAARVRALREHGQTAKYHHELEGWTARLDTLQAAVLLRKLPHLDEWNDRRRAAAAVYAEALAGVGDLRLPAAVPGSEPAWHLYVVRTADPDALAAFLRERGIGTGRHYPVPPHLSPAYAHLGHREGAFPVAERLSRECLSLPIFPGITEAELAHVAESVAAYFDG